MTLTFSIIDHNGACYSEIFVVSSAWARRHLDVTNARAIFRPPFESAIPWKEIAWISVSRSILERVRLAEWAPGHPESLHGFPRAEVTYRDK